MSSSRQVPGTSDCAHGRIAVLRAVPERARMRGTELHGIRAHHAGTGTGGFRAALACVGARRVGYISDPFIRLARAARALVAGLGLGRTRWLFRAY